MKVSANTFKAADIFISPQYRKTSGPRYESDTEHPTLICEVAFTHPKTYKDLSDLLTQWISSHTMVMIAIGIKIGILLLFFR